MPQYDEPFGLRHRIANVKAPLKHDLEAGDMVAMGDTKVGVTDNNIILNDNGAIEINSVDPALSATLGGTKSELSVGKQVDLKTEIDGISYNGNIINPQAKNKSPNIVNHYQLVARMPPGIVGGLLRGALVGVYAALQLFVDSESFEKL